MLSVATSFCSLFIIIIHLLFLSFNGSIHSFIQSLVKKSFPDPPEIRLLSLENLDISRSDAVNSPRVLHGLMDGAQIQKICPAVDRVRAGVSGVMEKFFLQ